jgi:hypothetical protein
MKLLIILILTGSYFYSSGQNVKIKQCSMCGDTVINTSNIHVWLHDMSKTDSVRWVKAGRKTIGLPHIGNYKIMHDTAWVYNKK